VLAISDVQLVDVMAEVEAVKGKCEFRASQFPATSVQILSAFYTLYLLTKSMIKGWQQHFVPAVMLSQPVWRIMRNISQSYPDLII